MRHVSDDERRARLAVRHALAPAYRVDSPEAATRAMTVLHATDAATVYLSSWARVESLRIADVDGELYEQRSLVRQLAMRRTLFVFPRDLLPAVWPSASARVAGIERARMVKDVVKAGLADDGDAWLDRARSEVLKLLVDAPDGRSAIEIRQAVPMIDVKVAVSAGEVWSAARVVTHLGATVDIVRGTNNGRWAASRPQWTLMYHWLGRVPSRGRLVRLPRPCVAGCTRSVPAPRTTSSGGWAPRRPSCGRRSPADATTVSPTAAPRSLPDDLTRWATPARGWPCCRCSTRRSCAAGPGLLPRPAPAPALRHPR
jgi:hypothetical protein